MLPIYGNMRPLICADMSGLLGWLGRRFLDDAGRDLVDPQVCRVFVECESVADAFTGPGELNGPWRITSATEDFSGVEGGGDWAGFENSETMTGEIEYSS